MASRPPGPCCTQGFKHEGTPSGTIVKVAEKWDAYVSVPRSDQIRKDVAVLVIPDIMGIWDNTKLLADEFAGRGYTCMVLDIFNGDALTLNDMTTRDIPAWVANGSNGQNPHTPEFIDPIVLAAIQTLKSEYGALRIGSVGYCFGAKFTVRHFKSGIDVGYVAHPSFVTDEELAAITGPLSVAAAEFDHIFPVEDRHRSEAILGQTKQPFQVFLYSAVSHGFAVRGDLSDKQQRLGKEQAFWQAITWFDTYL